MTDQEDPKRITLDCEHEIWIRPPMPNVGESFWCGRCGNYQTVGPNVNGKIYLDTWSCEKNRKRFWGICEQTACDYRVSDVNFYHLKNRMEGHYLREHTMSSLVFRGEVPIPARLPPNSEAPF